MTQRYAYKDVALQLSLLLKKNLTSGKYDNYTKPEDFKNALTIDLRSLNHDKHLTLNYDPSQNASPLTQNVSESPEQRAKRFSVFNRQMNYGMEKVQFFPGNVGYIKMNYFDAFLDYSGNVINASFDFLKNSDAIILDLRDNTGGASTTVGYIAGLFFDTTTLIGTSYNRYTDSTTPEYLQPREKEHLLTNADLYVLTSTSTISGGEALAYILKYMKRAKVIGATSAGAANPGRIIRINSTFTAFIPNRYSRNIVSQTNWEGTGVPVDINIDPTSALDKARLEALITLKAKTTDTIAISKYSKYITFLNGKLLNKTITESEARQYIGHYENDRHISYQNGKLFYAGLSESGGELIPISADAFMTDEGDVTVTFKRDSEKKVSHLSSLWTLGSSPSVSRKLD